MNTPPVTLSLMVTNPDDLATMLAVLRQNDRHDDDKVKQARAERDEATSEAIGWRKAAEEAQNRFIEASNRSAMLEANNLELCEHSESLADQVERLTAQLNSATQRLDVVTQERDDCSELLAKANEKLDGGPNQRISDQALMQQVAENITTGRASVDERNAAWHERHRLLGTVADLHPDEQCTATDQYSDQCERAKPHEGSHRSRHGEFGYFHPDEDPRDHEATLCEARPEPLSAFHCLRTAGHPGKHAGPEGSWFDQRT